MYRPIQISDTRLHPSVTKNFNIELFNVDSFNESIDNTQWNDTLYTEAVFADGKKKLDSILKCVTNIRNELLKQIDNHEEDEKNKIKNGRIFNPKAFWKHQYFKDLEDEIKKVFGFRSVLIQPYIEKYNSKDKMFESKIMNCAIYQVNRFPIEGIVTDNGFYDKSNSLTIDIVITLGLLKNLEPDEIVGIFLHEFGHAIDPALVSISYIEVNTLSKYLTDRKGALTTAEKNTLKSYKMNEGGKDGGIGGLLMAVGVPTKTIFTAIKGFIFGKETVTKKNLEKIRKIIQSDNEKFNKQNFTEAFADNFSRMYGYGVPCARGIQKITKSIDDRISSRWKKEKMRQQAILDMTKDALNDAHKTDVHRIYALIKEYEADIKNPNTPAVVKNQLKEDLEEMKKLMDQYLNNFSEFQNRINNLIYEELKQQDKSSVTTESSEDEDIYDELFEEEYYDEKSNGNLKFDYRQVKAAKDYPDRGIKQGDKLLCIYDLKGAQITYPGHAWGVGNYDGSTKNNEDAAEMDKANKEVQKNIAKKGNTDHQSWGQRLITVKDLKTGKQWNAYKHVDTNLRKNLEKSKDFGMEFEVQGVWTANSNHRKFIIKLGEVETEENRTYKSTKNFTYLRTGDKYNLGRLAGAEKEHKYFRGVEKDNISDLADFGNLMKIAKANGYKGNIYKNNILYHFQTLTSITIPNSVTKIDSGAFAGCIDLQSITIPKSVTEIGDSAFDGCESLKSITIPNSVTEIGDRAFANCKSLQSITIPNSVTTIGKSAFIRCSNLQSITIHNSVTKIGNYAFDCCRKLASITIPNSVTEIDFCAFSNCNNLKDVKILGNPKIDINAFEYCDNLSEESKKRILELQPKAVFESTEDEDIYDELFEEEYFEEKSHGLLTKAFRQAYDIDRECYVKIIYDLTGHDNPSDQPIEILSNRAHTNHGIDGNEMDKKLKHLRRYGDTDHSSRNQRVLAIENWNNHEKYKSANVIGPRFFANMLEYFRQYVPENEQHGKSIRELINLCDDIMKDQFNQELTTVKVGEIDTHWSHKTTNLPIDPKGFNTLLNYKNKSGNPERGVAVNKRMAQAGFPSPNNPYGKGKNEQIDKKDQQRFGISSKYNYFDTRYQIDHKK